MKHFIFLFCIILLFGLMLCFPQATLIGASNGLLLWFQTILPTLLPFMIVSNLLIKTNAIDYISRPLTPIIQPIFRVSSASCFAIIVGFLCGYPMGAKAIADLIHTKRISVEEGQYLLSFCNNSSPMFILGYLVLQNFKDHSLALPALLILLASPILCSFFFRKHYSKSFDKTNLTKSRLTHFEFQFQHLDNCIMNGFEMITKVGGYIILFSILFSLAGRIPYNWFLPLLEISNGIPYLLHQEITFNTTVVLSLALTSFGGICAISQTYSMIQNTGMRIFPYIIQKLITTMVTSLLAFIYVSFILR